MKNSNKIENDISQSNQGRKQKLPLQTSIDDYRNRARDLAFLFFPFPTHLPK
jgi:hypothetical protein